MHFKQHKQIMVNHTPITKTISLDAYGIKNAQVRYQLSSNELHERTISKEQGEKLKGFFGGIKRQDSSRKSVQINYDLDEEFSDPKDSSSADQMLDPNTQTLGEKGPVIEEVRSVFIEESSSPQKRTHAQTRNTRVSSDPGIKDKDARFLEISYKRMRGFKTESENGYLILSKKDQFEVLHQHKDDWPLFKTRKFLKLVVLWAKQENFNSGFQTSIGVF